MAVRNRIWPGETVFVLLDSNHTKAHVLAGLKVFAPLVTVVSYIVATDGIMQDLVVSPRANPMWEWDNPQQAAKEFVEHNPGFILNVRFQDRFDLETVEMCPNSNCSFQ